MSDRIKLTESSAYDFIEKIICLEKAFGKNAKFNMLDISELWPYRRDYNKIAKQIANFVGCSGYFVVTVEGDIESAGNIQDEDEFSFIALSSDMAKHFETAVAVIAHEIMHRLLKNNRVRYSEEIDNEVLTDIATVYMGLGELSLNGSYFEHCEFKTEKSSDKEKIITHKYNIGYIDEECFCFIFLIINKIRNINIPYSLFRFNGQVEKTLKRVSESSIYNKMMYYLSDEEYNDKLKNETAPIAERFKDISEELSSFESKLNELKKEKAKIGSALTKINSQIFELDNPTEYNPVLRKLQSIYTINRIEDKIDLLKTNFEKFSQNVKAITDDKNSAKSKNPFHFFRKQ